MRVATCGSTTFISYKIPETTHHYHKLVKSFRKSIYKTEREVMSDKHIKSTLFSLSKDHQGGARGAEWSSSKHLRPHNYTVYIRSKLFLYVYTINIESPWLIPMITSLYSESLLLKFRISPLNFIPIFQILVWNTCIYRRVQMKDLWRY